MNRHLQETTDVFFSEDRKNPFKLSRSGIEEYMKCPRCFYLYRRCGIKTSFMYAYTLNIAVDKLLQKEFDIYRTEGKVHPVLIDNGLNAIPFSHPDFNDWRIVQRGLKHHHQFTNFLVHGAPDDIWISPSGQLIVVDYKATSTTEEMNPSARISYKRQLEIYQWMLRRTYGFDVSNTAYLFICNGDKTKDKFGGMLLFNISLMPIETDDSWIEGILGDIKVCLMSNIIPDFSKDCRYCQSWNQITKQVELMVESTKKAMF